MTPSESSGLWPGAPLTRSGIEVEVEDERPARGEPLFTASVRMGDDGKCRLVIGDEEVKLWQVSKRALEPLFFGGPVSAPDQEH